MRILAVIGIVALTACTARVEPDGDVDVDPVTDAMGDWDANLSPRANSGVSGSAAARSTLVNSGASVRIWGAQSGARHPWHVHTGTCASGGPILGAASAYPVLAVGSNGGATASASLDVALSEGQSYHVNVHRSPADMSVISCGDLND